MNKHIALLLLSLISATHETVTFQSTSRRLFASAATRFRSISPLKKIGIATTIGGGIAARTAYPHLFHADWTVDERPITTSWPQETVAWLRQHEVPDALKQQIDAVLSKEGALQLLSSVYNWREWQFKEYGRELPVTEIITRRDRDRDSSRQKRDKDVAELKAQGFCFLGIGWDDTDDNLAFWHRDMPGYVFKMSSNEPGNVGRIAGAESLRKRLPADRRYYNNYFISPPVVIPQKHVYIVPFRSSVSCKNIPKVLVLAEKIPPLYPTLNERINSPQQDKCDLAAGITFLRANGYSDTHIDNVYVSQRGIAVIDTEDVASTRKIPGLSEYTCHRGVRSAREWSMPLPSTLLHERAMLPQHKGLVSYRLRREIPCINRFIQHAFDTMEHGY